MKPIIKVNEIVVTYKRKRGLSRISPITTSKDASEIIISGFDKRVIHLQEQFVVLYLNTANLPIGLYRASTGGVSGTIVDVKLVLSIALKTAASSLIIAHNHPSGNLSPSKADIELTKKLKGAAQLMDIKLFDHLIFTDSDVFHSMADEGLC